MYRESVENGVADIPDTEKEEDSYARYLKLGGVINEKDYQKAIDQTLEPTLDRHDPEVRNRISQAEEIARHAGIRLNNLEKVLDPRVLLYVLLRSDVKPKDVKYHHSQMSDQKIFGEVLRMYEDADSLNKLIKAYPGISFDYKSTATSAAIHDGEPKKTRLLSDFFLFGRNGHLRVY